MSAIPGFWRTWDKRKVAAQRNGRARDAEPGVSSLYHIYIFIHVSDAHAWAWGGFADALSFAPEWRHVDQHGFPLLSAGEWLMAPGCS